MRQMTDNLDYLAARLHGRRSRMAEGTSLGTLCQLRTVSQFAAAVLGGAEIESAAEGQRRLVQNLASEVAEIAAHGTGPNADLLHWLVMRFHVENLKVLLRSLSLGPSVSQGGEEAPHRTVDRDHEAIETTQAERRRHLIPLPPSLAAETDSLAAAGSLAEFVHRLPRGALRRNLEQAQALHPDEPRPFFFEVALDRGYFQELLSRAETLADEDRELIKRLAIQETDLFHFLLVTRGRFIYGLEPQSLLPWHVAGTALSLERFTAMLAESDLRAAARHAAGRVVDDWTGEESGVAERTPALDAATLEALAWSRFRRLANAAFRRSHMGLGAVVAYIALRRVEVANLITILEGIRTGAEADSLQARLLPRHQRQGTHV